MDSILQLKSKPSLRNKTQEEITEERRERRKLLSKVNRQRKAAKAELGDKCVELIIKLRKGEIQEAELLKEFDRHVEHTKARITEIESQAWP
jgi:hypothetical protein